MKETPLNSNLNRLMKKTDQEDNLQGYPPYPPGEDIYGKCQKDRKIDPEDPAGSSYQGPFCRRA